MLAGHIEDLAAIPGSMYLHMLSLHVLNLHVLYLHE